MHVYVEALFISLVSLVFYVQASTLDLKYNIFKLFDWLTQKDTIVNLGYKNNIIMIDYTFIY